MNTKIHRITRGRETKGWGDGSFSSDYVKNEFFESHNLCTGGWLIFSVLSFALTAVLMVINSVLRYCFPAKDATHNVVVMKIFGRHKTDDMKLPAAHDFHAIHQRWTTPSELLSPNWMIYTMNHSTVTFVRMPHSELQYQSKQASFLYSRQYSDAEYVATVDIQTFLNFGAEIGKPKDKVLLISNSGRCGSTLLAQLLQIDGLTTSFSEPDIFFALGAQIQDQSFGTTIGDYAPLLRSIINVLCKNQTVGTSYVFKSRCFCNALLPVIDVAVPEVKNIFLYRVDINKGCQSMTRDVLNGQYEWKHLGFPFLDQLWVVGSSLEKVALRGVKPRNLWEYGATVYAVHYSYLLDYVADNDNFHKMKYETLLADTPGELAKIYEIMQWPVEHIQPSLECMSKDSQEHSPLAREELAQHKVQVMPLSADRAAEIEYILRLPSGFFKPGFQFDHSIDYER